MSFLRGLATNLPGVFCGCKTLAYELETLFLRRLLCESRLSNAFRTQRMGTGGGFANRLGEPDPELN